VIFYRYQKYAKDKQEPHDHGNLGLLNLSEQTKQVVATVKCILDKEVDHMLHKTRSTKVGEKVVSKVLSSTFQWKGKMKVINEINATFGLMEVSVSNLNKIRSSKFFKYEVKKLRDNFAYCATYDNL